MFNILAKNIDKVDKFVPKSFNFDESKLRELNADYIKTIEEVSKEVSKKIENRYLAFEDITELKEKSLDNLSTNASYQRKSRRIDDFNQNIELDILGRDLYKVNIEFLDNFTSNDKATKLKQSYLEALNDLETSQINTEKEISNLTLEVEKIFKDYTTQREKIEKLTNFISIKLFEKKDELSPTETNKQKIEENIDLIKQEEVNLEVANLMKEMLNSSISDREEVLSNLLSKTKQSTSIWNAKRLNCMDIFHKLSKLEEEWSSKLFKLEETVTEYILLTQNFSDLEIEISSISNDIKELQSLITILESRFDILK